MTHVVNERVAGTRHFSVGGIQPPRGCERLVGRYLEIEDSTCIWYENGGNKWEHAESYGRVFSSTEERDEYLLVHGYIREYFTSPHLRLHRVLKAIGSKRPIMAYEMSREDAMIMLAYYQHAK